MACTVNANAMKASHGSSSHCKPGGGTQCISGASSTAGFWLSYEWCQCQWDFIAQFQFGLWKIKVSPPRK